VALTASRASSFPSRGSRSRDGVLAGLAGGAADVIGSAQNRAVQEQQLKQQQQQFQQTFDVNEAERKRQQEQANRLAALFIPRR